MLSMRECLLNAAGTVRFVLIDGSPFGGRHWQNWEYVYFHPSDAQALAAAHDELLAIKAAHAGESFEQLPADAQVMLSLREGTSGNPLLESVNKRAQTPRHTSKRWLHLCGVCSVKRNSWRSEKTCFSVVQLFLGRGLNGNFHSSNDLRQN